jgi:glycosyltransferase involved in cell wall biosynthesis
MARVSISIPCYNEERWISETIESVLNQTFSDFELLLVDDGSTDNTADIISEYTDDPRVRYIYQENQGFAGARNTGLEEGDGDYYAFIGADDMWKPTKLEQQVAFLEANDTDIVHSNAEHIDEDGEVFERRHENKPPEQTDMRDFIRDLFFRSFICIQSVLCRESAIEGERFDEDLSINCDHDMWLRLAGDNDFGYIDECLVEKRFHGGNISSNYEVLFDQRKRLVEKTVRRYPFLEPYESKKLSMVHLIYALNLLVHEADFERGRLHLRISLAYNPGNWKSIGTYALSYGGSRLGIPITRRLAKEG